MTEVWHGFFDAYSDEADITTSGNSGDQWSAVSTNGTSTLKADSSVAVNYGSFTDRTNTMRVVIDGSASTVNAEFSVTSESVLAFLFPFQVTTRPTGGNIDILLMISTDFNYGCGIGLNTTGQLILTDDTQAAIHTGSTALTLDTTFWIGVKLKGHATQGYMEAKLYDAVGGLLETIGDTTADESTDNLIFKFQSGMPFNTDASVAYRYGEIWVDDTDYPPLPTFGVVELRGSIPIPGL